MEVALGELNLNPSEFYEYSFNEFLLEVEGSRKNKIEEWHRTRALAYTMAKPYLKNKNATIEQFWPLPGDKNFKKYTGKRFREMTQEERKAHIDSIRARLQGDGITNDN